jgi:hypothetical protein
MARSLEDRLTAKLDRSGDCWMWQGTTTTGGYGMIRLGSTMAYTHRVAHELWVGPIPAGLQVHHLCHVRACANPAHLTTMTQSAHRRLHAADVDACPAGHSYDEANTYIGKNGARFCRACNAAKARARREAKRTLAEKPPQGKDMTTTQEQAA